MKNDDKVAQAAAARPKTAFFSFGMNDLGMYSGNALTFIEKYTSLIDSFMKDSPETVIYVNSISKPSDEKISSGGYFYKWEEYNEAIKDMCKSLDIEYIDNTSILYDNPNLYAGDGVHVTSAYYPIWIERMIKQLIFNDSAAYFIVYLIEKFIYLFSENYAQDKRCYCQHS